MTQEQTESPYYGPWAPPAWNPPENPPGYGDSRQPSGGYSVEAQDLINAAAAWDDVSSALKKAWELTQEGWAQPGLFGMHDTLYVNGRLHMLVNRVIVNACADGRFITAQLADGLVETANDYSNTDTTQGANFRPYDDRAGG